MVARAFAPHLLCLVLLAPSEYCGPEDVDSTILTKVAADGTIERAVCEPAAWLPPRSESATTRWAETGRTDVCEVNVSGWNGSVSRPSGSEPAPGPPDTFAAAGRFRAVADIPDHYNMVSRDGTRVSHFRRAYDRRDYGFVVEHAWSETLSDTTTPSQSRSALRQLLPLEIAVASHAIRRTFGAQYDVEAFLTWLPGFWTAYKTALGESLAEASEAARKTGDDDVDLDAGMTEKLVRAGYADHDLAEDDSPIRPQVLALVRGLDGSQPPEEVSAAIDRLASWFLLPLDLLRGEPPKLETDADKALWSALAESAAEAAGGDAGRFMDVERRLSEGWAGAWARMAIADRRHVFHVAVDVPGLLIETNGTANGDHRVSWKLPMTAAYPSGATLWARSLEGVPDVQQRLLGGTPFVSKPSMARFADLVRPDPMLAEIMRRSARAGSLEPLRGFRKEVGVGDKTERQRRLTELWLLLGLD